MSDSKCNPNPVEASEVKKGHHIILKGRPCKIVDVTHAKTGKHGHMKVTMTGIDVLNSQKCILNVPGHKTVTRFDLIKKEYEVMQIQDNVIEYLDDRDNLLQMKVSASDSETVADLLTTFPKAGDKRFLITVVIAPVEKSEGVYVDEEVLESFKTESG